MKNAIACLLITFLILNLSGCSQETLTDFSIKNERYSYQTTETVSLSADSFTAYDEAYNNKLKEKYQLEELVAGCDSELEKVEAVTKWVTNLWKHDGANVPAQSDPLSILDDVTEKGMQYRCVEYSTVIGGCLNAIGIQARVIGLKTQDVETRETGAGHVAVEAYT